MNRKVWPEKMEVCFFNMDTGYQCLRFEGGKISSDLLENPVEPSLSDWGKFWDNLDEIGFWDWKEDYEQCCLVDGYEWNANIAYNGREMQSAGLNDGPTQVVGDGMVSTLEHFLDALEDLCGVRLGNR